MAVRGPPPDQGRCSGRCHPQTPFRGPQLAERLAVNQDGESSLPREPHPTAVHLGRQWSHASSRRNRITARLGPSGDGRATRSSRPSSSRRSRCDRLVTRIADRARPRTTTPTPDIRYRKVRVAFHPRRRRPHRPGLRPRHRDRGLPHVITLVVGVVPAGAALPVVVAIAQASEARPRRRRGRLRAGGIASTSSRSSPSRVESCATGSTAAASSPPSAPRTSNERRSAASSSASASTRSPPSRTPGS